MPNDSEIILEFGTKGLDGLQHYWLYCRRCHKVSDLIPAGCLSMILLRMKPTALRILNPEEEYKNARARGIHRVFPHKIEDAMRTDGLIKSKK
jgi:hypothetical protein